MRHHGQIMRHHHIGQPALGSQTVQQVQDLGLNRGIKRRGRLVQQQQLGFQDQRAGDGDTLALEAPGFSRSGPLDADERSRAIALSGVAEEAVVEAVHVVNGPKWQLLRLRSAADVLAAKPAAEALPGTDIGLAGPYPAGGESQWELRAFFANQHGKLVEDPVTGSFNAGVARHLFETGLAEGSYIAAQGRMTGADGLVLCERDADGSIWIGGQCHTIACGAALPVFE